MLISVFVLGSEYIPVPVMEDDSVTVVAVDKEGHKAKDLLSWKSLRDINESLAPLFTVTNPNTGTPTINVTVSLCDTHTQTLAHTKGNKTSKQIRITHLQTVIHSLC